MTKVRLVKDTPRRKKGTVLEVDDERAKRWIKGGIAKKEK